MVAERERSVLSDGAQRAPLHLGATADPATKQPRGEPTAVHHVHREGRRLYTDLVPLGLTVARDRLVYATDSMTSEIWMAETK